MLQEKTVLLGVCACTPAYKALDLIGMLKRKGADVKTAVTENATELVPVAMLERMSGNPVSVKQFGNEYAWDPEKKAWGMKGDVLVIAPCTANMIGKLANGIADDFISTNAMAFPGPKIIAVNMNPKFWINPAVQRNIAQLKEDGYVFVDNGDPEHPSRMPPLESIEAAIEDVLS
ncbi:MAG: flavoprotein [Clostridia bacterium]|nr:flavoprotein [Clostridia bacterium]